MKRFTVILLRPDYIASDDNGGFGKDIYIGYVEAENVGLAIDAARLEVFTSDSEDDHSPNGPEDYALVAAFDGVASVALLGMQE